MASASCPTGAITSPRWSRSLFSITRRHHFLSPTVKDRDTGQNTLELFQRFADANPLARLQLEFANRLLVLTAPFFNHGDRLLHLTGGFEEAQKYHHIGQIAQIDRRFR